MRMQKEGSRGQGVKGSRGTHKSIFLGFFLIFHFLLLTSYCSLSYAASNSSSNEKGVPISMELRDVELSDVLRALGQEHGINIIIDEKSYRQGDSQPQKCPSMGRY